MKQSILILFMVMISGIVSAADVTLQWKSNEEPDIAGYKIYYDTKSGSPYNGDSINGRSPIEVKLSDIDPKNPEYTMTGLNQELRWYFVVTAYDTEGLESDYSNEVSTYNYVKPSPVGLKIKVIVTIETNIN